METATIGAITGSIGCVTGVCSLFWNIIVYLREKSNIEIEAYILRSGIDAEFSDASIKFTNIGRKDCVLLNATVDYDKAAYSTIFPKSPSGDCATLKPGEWHEVRIRLDADAAKIPTGIYVEDSKKKKYFLNKKSLHLIQKNIVAINTEIKKNKERDSLLLLQS